MFVLVTPTRQVLLHRERASRFLLCYTTSLLEQREMTKVFIGNLSDDAKGHHVEDFFAKFGTLREITLKNGFGKNYV